MCDTDIRKTEFLKERYKAERVTEDANDCIEAEDIDALIIATPTYLHYPLAVAGLEYDKDVFVEVPVSISAKEAKEIYEKAERKKRIVAVGLWHRLREDVELLRTFVEKKELGDIFYAKAGWLRSFEEWPLTGWRRDKMRAGGGVFLSIATLVLDFSLYITGDKKPLFITGVGFKRDKELPFEDTAIATMRFEDNSLLSVEVGWHPAKRDILYFNLYGSKGTARLFPLEIYKEIYGRLSNVTPGLPSLKQIYLNAFEKQMKLFVDSVMQRKPYPLSSNVVLNICSIVDGFYKSWEKKEEVSISSL